VITACREGIRGTHRRTDGDRLGRQVSDRVVHATSAESGSIRTLVDSLAEHQSHPVVIGRERLVSCS
jgi:hypothetical protein